MCKFSHSNHWCYIWNRCEELQLSGMMVTNIKIKKNKKTLIIWTYLIHLLHCWKWTTLALSEQFSIISCGEKHWDEKKSSTSCSTFLNTTGLLHNKGKCCLFDLKFMTFGFSSDYNFSILFPLITWKTKNFLKEKQYLFSVKWLWDVWYLQNEKTIDFQKC